MRLGDILRELKEIRDLPKGEEFISRVSQLHKSLLDASNILNDAEKVLNKVKISDIFEEQLGLLNKLYETLSDARAEPRIRIKKSRDIGKSVYVYYIYSDESTRTIGKLMKEEYLKNRERDEKLAKDGDLDAIKELPYFEEIGD